MNSKEQIMQMVAEGILSVDEALRLLDAIEESEQKSQPKQEIERRPSSPIQYTRKAKMFRIFVDSSKNDKVRVNVPVSLIRAGLDFSRQLEMSGIDMGTSGLDIEMILQAVEDGQVGEIVDVVSAEGDHVRIVVD